MRRKKDYEFCLGEKQIELVKSVTYLEYKMKENYKEGNYMKRVKGKANGYLGKVWSCGERKCKDD